jgi:phosphorylated CTD-interacting factor 1
MAAEGEKRMDADCNWYSRREFEEFYGDEAKETWDRCPPEGHEWVAVFHCAKTTEKECIDRSLLGGPMNMQRSLITPDRGIREGTALLLFNFQTRETLAPYRAAGAPGRNLEPTAWGGRFPWQVRTTGTAKRWPTGTRGELTALLKKNGTWISSHKLPAEWFPRPAARPKKATASKPTAVRPADQPQVTKPADSPAPQPSDAVGTPTGSDVFSDLPSSQESSSTTEADLAPANRTARPQYGDVNPFAPETSRPYYEDINPFDRPHYGDANPFDVNPPPPSQLEPEPEPELSALARAPAPARRSGLTAMDEMIQMASSSSSAAHAPQTTEQRTRSSHLQQFVGLDDEPPLAAAVGTTTGVTWQQQQLVAELEEEVEDEDEYCCTECGETGDGATDTSDGHWYCSACWAAMEQQADLEHPPQLVYMKLSQTGPCYEAERRLLVVLDAFGVRYREHRMAEDEDGNYVIRDEIDVAKTEAPNVCILSAKSTNGRSGANAKMGIIWNGQWNEEFGWSEGIQKLIQLGNGKKRAVAKPEDAPEVAKTRDYLVHKVIIARFQEMLLGGPEAVRAAAAAAPASASNASSGRTRTRNPGPLSAAAPSGGGGGFAALSGLDDNDNDDWSESDGEASPAAQRTSSSSTTTTLAHTSSSIGLLARWRWEPQRAKKEALKSAAKLMSTYFFRDLAEDTLHLMGTSSSSNSSASGSGSNGAGSSSGGGGEANGGSTQQRQQQQQQLCADAWHRAGERKDPMIPCNESAWPNVRIAFGLLIERWWGVERCDPVVQASMNELLKWCRTACHKLEEQASARHNPNLLHPDWQDDESGLDPPERDLEGMVRLRYKGCEVKLDNYRMDFLQSLLLQHAPDRQAQFNTRVFNCLLRYETLAKFDQGTQGSLPERVFDVLASDFGVDHECFASPLNVTARSFNSVFPDVDRFFGSKGSFFDFWPDTGAYEANPPFDEGSVAAMFHHINAILTSAEERERRRQETTEGGGGGSSEALPLLFITVTPFVPSDALCRPDDRFVLSQPLTLKAHEHAYTMGMRHRKSDEWTCPTDTVVCFIGNSAAAKAWPVTNRKLATLKAAWAPDSRAQASAATASAAAGNSYRLAPRSLASLS